MSLLKKLGWCLPLILLTGCNDASKVLSTFQNQPRPPATITKTNGVALPALPIIQAAVTGLVPTVDGQRSDQMMLQVCALARGESTQQQVNQTLHQQGIDLCQVPQQGHPLSLLVNTDMSRRVTACAAYIATSVMMLPKTSEFMIETKAEQPTNSPKTFSVDPQKLQRFLGVQLAVAKADADLFALIATELEKTPGLTLDQYNLRAKSLFSTIAAAYLQRVKELYAGAQNVEYTLLEYSDSDFKFRSSNGHLFEYGYDGLSLTFNRTPWYGAGKLLGKSYLLDVAYFDPALIKIIEQTDTKTTPSPLAAN